MKEPLSPPLYSLLEASICFKGWGGGRLLKGVGKCFLALGVKALAGFLCLTEGQYVMITIPT